MSDIIWGFYLFKKWKKSWDRDPVGKTLKLLALWTSEYDPKRFSARVKNGCITYNKHSYSHETLRMYENCTVNAAPNLEEKTLLVCTKKSKEFICFAKVL